MVKRKCTAILKCTLVVTRYKTGKCIKGLRLDTFISGLYLYKRFINGCKYGCLLKSLANADL
uniref:Uncharacterized protein n=1 Tax=Anguilla anguilla TaxID=7936 RepID=A0A0E9QGH1_ANGAN